MQKFKITNIIRNARKNIGISKPKEDKESSTEEEEKSKKTDTNAKIVKRAKKENFTNKENSADKENGAKPKWNRRVLKINLFKIYFKLFILLIFNCFNFIFNYIRSLVTH